MKRVATALVLIPVVLYLVIWAPAPLIWAGAAAVAILCYREYLGIAEGFGVRAPGPVGYAAGLGLLAVGAGDTGLYVTIVTLLVIALAMRSKDLAETLPRASAAVLGVIYIFGSWKCALLLRELGVYWLLFALSINWVGDAAAYYVGRSLGRHKLAPHVSPGKTWEGAAGSLAAALLFGAAYLHRFAPEVSMAEALAISMLANAAGQLGDLAESALKRGASLKDSGTLLPGHGGMLDRVDSALFAMPAVYAYLKLAAALQAK